MPARPTPARPAAAPSVSSAGHLGEERRLRDDQLGHRRPRRCRPRRARRASGRPGAVGLEVGERHQVVHQPHVAARAPCPSGRRRCRSPASNTRVGLGRRRRRPRPARARSAMCSRYGLADLGVRVEPVVLLVGQPEPALADEHHVAVRVARVGLGLEVDQPAHARGGRSRPTQPQQLRRRARRRRSRPAARSAARPRPPRSASSSMKLAYRSAISASRCPGSPRSMVVMMSRTAASASSRSAMNDPASGLSPGSRVAPASAPLTWRKRSSCTRTFGSKVGEVEGGHGLDGGLRHAVDATEGQPGEPSGGRPQRAPSRLSSVDRDLSPLSARVA